MSGIIDASLIDAFQIVTHGKFGRTNIKMKIYKTSTVLLSNCYDIFLQNRLNQDALNKINIHGPMTDASKKNRRGNNYVQGLPSEKKH